MSLSAEDKELKHQQSLDKALLRKGFNASIGIAGLCLFSGVGYLVYFLSISSGMLKRVMGGAGGKPIALTGNEFQAVVQASLYTSAIGLLSCALFIGLAFGLLGFCLFLIGANGSIDATLDAPQKSKVQVTGMSAGAFIILCACLLIGFCATSRPKLSTRAVQDSKGRVQTDWTSGDAPAGRPEDVDISKIAAPGVDPSSSPSPTPSPSPSPGETGNGDEPNGGTKQ